MKLDLGPEYSSSVFEEEVIGEHLDVAWGVLKIVPASDQKRKYGCLLRLLEKHMLIALPPNFN